MRKISLILLSVGAVLTLSLYWQGPATAQDPQIEEPAGPVYPPGDTATCWGDWWIGRKIGGSWYDEFMHYPNWPDQDGAWPGTGVLTLGADGTVTWSSLGPVGDQAGGGTWERTGWREITVTVLIMGFGADPITEDDEGNLIHSHSHLWTGRSEIVFELDDDFQAAFGIGCTDAFLPGEDPLSEDPNAPFFTMPYVEHTCRKVNVVPCSLHDGG